MGASLTPSFMTPGPDAINALLAHLTGVNMPGVQQTPSANNPQPGAQLPGPQAAPMPPAIGPGTAQSLLQNPAIAQSLSGLLGGGPDEQPQGQTGGQAGMFHRVVGNLLGIPHAIASHAGPPIPPEYKVAVQLGLIPQEVADAARPQFLSNIFDPEGYRNNLDKIMGVMSTGRTLAESQRQLAARHAMAGLFPQPTPTGDPIKDHENLANWLASQFGYATSHNLPDIAKDMESALRGVMSVPPTPKNQIVPQGGAVVGPDGKPLYTAPALPKQYEPVPFVSKDGNRTVFVDPTTGKQINGEPVPAGYRNAAQARTEITVQGAEQRAAEARAAKAGTLGNLPAPLAAKVGQFGEMLKKADDLLPAMDALNVSLGQSAAQDIATHGVGVGGMHIPGTQGLGSMMVNKTPEYSRYQAALSPFILAAAHALSGARINDTQVHQIRSSIEIKPGDAPTVRTQKIKNTVDLTNSIGGSLPANAIGEQEGQMAPESLQRLQGYGYKMRAGAAAPSASKLTAAQIARAKTDPTYAAFLRSKGQVP